MLYWFFEELKNTIIYLLGLHDKEIKPSYLSSIQMMNWCIIGLVCSQKMTQNIGFYTCTQCLCWWTICKIGAFNWCFKYVPYTCRHKSYLLGFVIGSMIEKLQALFDKNLRKSVAIFVKNDKMVHFLQFNYVMTNNVFLNKTLCHALQNACMLVVIEKLI